MMSAARFARVGANDVDPNRTRSSCNDPVIVRSSSQEADVNITSSSASLKNNSVTRLSRRDPSRSHCAFRCATAPTCSRPSLNIATALRSKQLQAYFFFPAFLLAFRAIFLAADFDFAFFAFFAMLPS
jgi:hypothetical protein